MSGETTIVVSLRPWAEGDLPLLERLLGDPAMTEHLGGPETLEQLRQRHQRYLAGPPGGGGMFVILATAASTGVVAGPGAAPAGSIGFWERQWQGQSVWEAGWSVLPEFQGRGIATQATAAIVERVRAAGTHRYLHAYPAVDNPPSNAICRKAGFTLLGPVDFEYPLGHFMRCNDWRLDLFDPQSSI